MKWFMALLAVIALGEAALSVCGSGHAHAHAAGAEESTIVMDHDHHGHEHHAAHAHHDHHDHHGHHGTDCDEATEPEPITDHDCPDCAVGRSCADCVMLTVTRVSGFQAVHPAQAGIETDHFVSVAPRLIHFFDPPPPKRVTSI